MSRVTIAASTASRSAHGARGNHASVRGFSFVELLVVLLVLALLLSLALPALSRSREAARRAGCTNNIRQLGLALHNYHDVHRALPPAGLACNEVSWHAYILPQIDRADIYAGFNFNAGQYYGSANGKNNPYGLTRIAVFLCPIAKYDKSLTNADTVDGKHTFTTHYYGIMGPRGPGSKGEYRVLSGRGPFAAQGMLTAEISRPFADVLDGLSNTYIVGELSWDGANSYRTWVRGVNGNPMSGAKNILNPIYRKHFDNKSGFNDVSLGSEHPGGTQLLFADGTVRFTSELIDVPLYKAQASIDGSEI